MGDYSDQFAAAVLNDIGAPQTAENFKFFKAWAQAEGGSAKNNPFNTTQSMPGATDYNSVHVRNYPDFNTGVAATVKTLTSGRYPDILSGLKSGTSAETTAKAGSLATWGTGGGVLRVLDGGGSLNPSPGTDATASAAATSTTACYWNWKSPSLGPIGGSTYCLDPILWLSLGLVGTGTFLVGAALVAIGSGHGAKHGRAVLSAVGPAKIAKVAQKARKPKVPAKPAAKESPAKPESKPAETVGETVKTETKAVA